MLVRRIPAKAASMVADEYEMPHKMDTGEKSVSFSEEDEVVEIAPRIFHKMNRKRIESLYEGKFFRTLNI